MLCLSGFELYSPWVSLKEPVVNLTLCRWLATLVMSVEILANKCHKQDPVAKILLNKFRVRKYHLLLRQENRQVNSFVRKTIKQTNIQTESVEN